MGVYSAAPASSQCSGCLVDSSSSLAVATANVVMSILWDIIMIHSKVNGAGHFKNLNLKYA